MKTVQEFKEYKQKKKLISMVTCYDHWSAKIVAKTDVDCLLVGDSVAMVVHGFSNTLQATTEMMALHTEAVFRAQTNKLIVTDLPFLAHRKGRSHMMNSVDKLMKAGASALKIETAPGQEKEVQYISESGVPVIGHLGLTPQYVHQFGGFKMQGKSQEDGQKILDHAKKLEQAGAHALVLECIPQALAQAITRSVQIPTIGIGAGLDVDGQVLVLHDLLGFNSNFKPRFVRFFAEGEKWMESAVDQFSQAVADKTFPNKEESFL